MRSEELRALNIPGPHEADGLRGLYLDADKIIAGAIRENLPGQATKKALRRDFSGKIHLLSIGKAACSMASAALEEIGDRIARGIVITKYGHSRGPIGNFEIYEAGHPIPDENSVKATEAAVDLARALTDTDELIFLVSGGGSALFEKPLPGITLDDVAQVASSLLAGGADILEFNTVRKRFSMVKAGRFAKMCEPAKVFAVVLSDVLGDRLDTIASGPAAPDLSTSDEALDIVDRYGLQLPPHMKKLLEIETPSETPNVTSVVTGSVRTLCSAAASEASAMGYKPFVLCTDMNCEAREAGRMIASIAREAASGNSAIKPPCAVIFGGETVVRLKGRGKGGRNQELALAAAGGIENLDGVVIFSLGSDGTDGPTDAAGGIVDGRTMSALRDIKLKLNDILMENDSYTALERIGRLIMTGPTGTNVNDVSIILCR
jgi:hydroxypyruvate reductase